MTLVGVNVGKCVGDFEGCYVWDVDVSVTVFDGDNVRVFVGDFDGLCEGCDVPIVKVNVGKYDGDLVECDIWDVGFVGENDTP